MQSAAMQHYAVFATVVALQLLFLAGWTGTVRVLRKQWVNPEDAKLNKGEQTEQDHPDVLRAKRAHLNALENAVPFFVVGYLYASVASSERSVLIYFGTFVAARILHSVFYLWGRQPFRTLTFAIGLMATVGMAVQVLRTAL